jgi:hypothetical protein
MGPLLYAVLDPEHGSASLSQAEELCRVARPLDFPLIISPETRVYHLLRIHAVGDGNGTSNY